MIESFGPIYQDMGSGILNEAEHRFIKLYGPFYIRFEGVYSLTYLDNLLVELGSSFTFE